ncbi:hypothetical protein [Sphingobacterium ginsenosidimutans]|uniref:Uncharacterized protein n=1 Tax=Sphingobacterium ginsenosidimutans TaxID=687845 RepID=A0ABP7ZRD5_9SPHI
MNMTHLGKFEHDRTIIDKYVKSSAFGKNKLVYAPLIIGIGLLFFLAFAIFEGLVETIGIGIISILSVIVVFCFILAAIINRSAHKKLYEETKTAPVCIAKKVYGNDVQNIYYCIYSTGEMRHDSSFINKIAEKIFAIPTNTNDKIDKEILDLFKIDFVKPGEFAKKLPLAFTDGVAVWRRQFALGNLPKDAQQTIEDNDRQFCVVAIVPENPRILTEQFS